MNTHMPKPGSHERIAQLEDELKQRDARVRELRAYLDKADQLISEMREQIEDGNAVIDSWIEGFDMVQNAAGDWTWDPFVEEYTEGWTKYRTLRREWNRFVPEYNAMVRPRNVGRPLAASDAQVEQVLNPEAGRVAARHRGGDQFGTRHRTHHRRPQGRPRPHQRHALERIDPDRKLEASWRARKRTRDALPKRLNQTLAKGRAS